MNLEKPMFYEFGVLPTNIVEAISKMLPCLCINSVQGLKPNFFTCGTTEELAEKLGNFLPQFHDNFFLRVGRVIFPSFLHLCRSFYHLQRHDSL